MTDEEMTNFVNTNVQNDIIQELGQKQLRVFQLERQMQALIFNHQDLLNSGNHLTNHPDNATPGTESPANGEEAASAVPSSSE